MPWFTRAERTARRGELLESAIGASTSLSGVIRSDGGLQIDGHFDGHIDVAGNVVVGEAGVVQVDVLRARNITVGGTVTGNIECGGRLEILSTGQVVGDIVADAIMIDQGGVFQGSSRMRSAMPVLPPPNAASPPTNAPTAIAQPPALDDVIIDLGTAPASEPAAPSHAAAMATPAGEPDPDPAEPVTDANLSTAAKASTVATTERSAGPASAPAAPAPVRRVASPAPERSPRDDRRSDGPPPSGSAPAGGSSRPEPVLDFALDIEPVIPDTAAGSASGAAHQPAAAAGDAATRRNRRSGGGRRR